MQHPKHLEIQVFICRLELSQFYTYTVSLKGTSIRQAPVFPAPQSITEKPMEVYYLDEWIITTLHVAGFLHPAIF